MATTNSSQVNVKKTVQIMSVSARLDTSSTVSLVLILMNALKSHAAMVNVPTLPDLTSKKLNFQLVIFLDTYVSLSSGRGWKQTS